MIKICEWCLIKFIWYFFVNVDKCIGTGFRGWTRIPIAFFKYCAFKNFGYLEVIKAIPFFGFSLINKGIIVAGISWTLVHKYWMQIVRVLNNRLINILYLIFDFCQLFFKTLYLWLNAMSISINEIACLLNFFMLST